MQQFDYIATCWHYLLQISTKPLHVNPSHLVELVFLTGEPGLISVSQKRMVNIAKLAEPNLEC